MRRERAKPRISSERRAAIAQERRNRTRMDILRAAYALFGQEKGRSTRIDDVCELIGVSRGTFYNYFSSMDELVEALHYDISHDVNVTVRALGSTLRAGAERCCAAIRYYLHRARDDKVWGWAMVNLSAAGPLFGIDTFHGTSTAIAEGFDVGEFVATNRTVARDLVLGTVLASMITLLSGEQPADHPEHAARQILIALGVRPEVVERCVRLPLSKLPEQKVLQSLQEPPLAKKPHAQEHHHGPGPPARHIERGTRRER